MKLATVRRVVGITLVTTGTIGFGYSALDAKFEMKKNNVEAYQTTPDESTELTPLAGLSIIAVLGGAMIVLSLPKNEKKQKPPTK